MFLDPEMELNGLDYSVNRYYYDLDELRQHINESVHNYYELGEMDTIDKYSYVYYTDEQTEEERKRYPSLNVYFIRNSDRSLFPDFNFNLTTDSLGPFDFNNTQLRNFISNTTNMRIEYEIEHNIPSESATPFDCFRWHIYQNFDFSYRNHIIESLSFERNY